MSSYDQIRANQMKELAKHLPLNSLGLPTGFWRADLLPLDELTARALGSATAGNEEETHNGVLSSESEGVETSRSGASTPSKATDWASGITHHDGSPDTGSGLSDLGRHSDHPSTGGQLESLTSASQPLLPYRHTNNDTDEDSDDGSYVNQAESNLPAILGLISVPTPLGLDQDVLDSAFVPLSYDEGYPALPDGQPFWNQLNFESDEAFQRFCEYVELGKKEFRILPNIAKGPADLQSLIQYSSFYYWPHRSRCYDLFFAASKKREREFLIYDLELSHLKEAQTLRKKITEYMETTEFMDMMTPMVAVNLLKLTWQMERASAGLPANGPSNGGFGNKGKGEGELPESSSLELVMRTMINKERAIMPDQADKGKTINPDGTISDPARDFHDKLLQSPDIAVLAQELIFKITSGKG